MLQAPAQPAPPPRRAVAAQAAILSAVIAACALAPRAGQAAIYLPLVSSGHAETLDWALAHGATVMGTGPAGGLILDHTPPGLAMRAAANGALLIAVPTYLCRQQESPIHG